jgi:hypothetical protein
MCITLTQLLVTIIKTDRKRCLLGYRRNIVLQEQCHPTYLELCFASMGQLPPVPIPISSDAIRLSASGTVSCST